MTAKEFRVALPNRPGELAKLAKMLGKKGVNITTIVGLAAGNTSTLAFLTEDESRALSVLKEGKYKFKAVPVVMVRMSDKPGALARVAKKLGNKKINIEGVYLVTRSKKMAQVAICVKDPKKAGAALR
ncbi:hypothetical protein HYR54_02375 [Candidatus Acetothermia bacterium]|nr:hypothetical protein [Candidatus Acetothermia bacterium]